ncbi:hypothetical protein [Ferribacterium limneticum]|uniref:hypothetical protein n=1 Tax=Ferribacterium limneticum TaxID=76259 RepID=UPI001CF92B55|nr:hypothetical protein [Ferribacterium limneticum]UCV26777.1 hypothetical protein KI617_10690 [Ferribacterium limneticum]UCV30694.1 hypothetical protein KI608_10690 [Ferribacterium limneticum]
MAIMESNLRSSVGLMRRRINSRPKLSLQVYAHLKAEDVMGFGVTVQELANRLVSIAVQARVRKRSQSEIADRMHREAM